MGISGISSYNDIMYQWQNEKLKSTGSSSSQPSSMMTSILGGSSSMTSQISSLVELTKYAMNAMGLDSNSRVTFNQISKYREQLQNEFNEGVKKGLAESGITDLYSLSFTLDANGKLVATGSNASDRKIAQAWLDANPSFGEDLRKSLTQAGIDEKKEIEFTISSTGRMTLVDKDSALVQANIDKKEDLGDTFRKNLKEAGIELNGFVEFIFDEEGVFKARGDSENIEKINSWLANNPDMGASVKDALGKNVETGSVSLKLGAEGNFQATLHNAENKDIQELLDKSAIGDSLHNGLSSLGIDPDISFSIQFKADGSINIVSDHKDRDKVQKFFEDNPELIKKYQQIEALTGIDDARKAMQISPSAMRKRIQIESIAAWWTDSGSAASYFGNYQDNSLSLLSGLNLKI